MSNPEPSQTTIRRKAERVTHASSAFNVRRKRSSLAFNRVRFALTVIADVTISGMAFEGTVMNDGLAGKNVLGRPTRLFPPPGTHGGALR